MAFTYAQVVAWTQNTAYRDQVKVAIQEVAQYMVEGNGGFAMSVNQLTSAFNAKRNPNQYIDWFVFYVASDATVQADGATPTDAHIKTVVDAKRMEIWS
jgi:hypothetical protein